MTAATRARLTCFALSCCLGTPACGAGSHPAAAAPCDEECQDNVAVRGVRTVLKYAFNFTVQGKPVGAQDATTKCLPLNGTQGSAHVVGDATSNAVEGASFVDLSFDLRSCSYAAPPDPSAEQNFTVTLAGVITEQGTLAVQPSSTTALLLHSDSLDISGTVYDPPLDYAVSGCTLDLNQNGNAIAGTMCDRMVGFTF